MTGENRHRFKFVLNFVLNPDIGKRVLAVCLHLYDLRLINYRAI